MKTFLGLILLVLALILQGCVTIYSAEPIRAWVVDAETKQPLAGVNVVANWQLQGGLEGGTNLGQMMVMETVTDSAGQFSFPGWGPKLTPAGYPWIYQNARLTIMDPQLLLFKSGYWYLALYNYPTTKKLASKGPWVRSSEWNGKTIEMRRFNGNLEEYAENLGSLNGTLENIAVLRKAELPRDECKWKKIPMMIVATGREAAMVKRSHVHYQFSNVYEHLCRNETYFLDKGCGSVNTFFRQYER